MLQFYREYRTGKYDEKTTIHVVSSEHFKDYLKIILPFFTQGLQYIAHNQDTIKNAVQGDLVSWNDYNPFKIRLP